MDTKWRDTEQSGLCT